MTTAFIKSLFPKRTSQSHKFRNGYVSVVAGSKEFPGSLRLACHAAAQTGAGGVQAIFPEALWPCAGSLWPEIMVYPYTEPNAFEVVEKATSRSKALLIGCGIGRSSFTTQFVNHVLRTTSLPCVIDADALFALTQQKDDRFIEQNCQGCWILTPHQGELSLLCQRFGYDPKTVNLKELAQKWQCIFLIKGFPSILYMPDGTHYETPTGNPAASTAGCGDVLSGIIAGFLAQDLSTKDAAILGLYTAGQAADDIIQTTKSHSLIASDIINQLPITLGRLSNS